MLGQLSLVGVGSGADRFEDLTREDVPILITGRLSGLANSFISLRKAQILLAVEFANGLVAN